MATNWAQITSRNSLVGPLFLALVFTCAASAQDLACPAVNPSPGNDFRGQTIVKGNFSYRDLTNANFSNTTLVAPYFAYANLMNANFQGAIFVTDDSNPAMVSDFSFANLQKTCFIGARFTGLAYFTNSTLTCADFSKTDLSSKNIIFGPSPLTFDRARSDCRLAFRYSVMDCEFLADWRYMDLSNADIKACLSQLPALDLSNAELNGVNLEGANLDGIKLSNAKLREATLDGASLAGADLSYATLLGAHLNKTNLTNASLYHAVLSNDTNSGYTNAASVRQSHLKNANLSYAQLSGVDFTYSNLYGDNPTATGICKTALALNQCGKQSASNYEGFACGCASVHGATMTQTKLTSTYLYGLDLTSAKMQGADFHQSVLTGANLNGAQIRSDTAGNPTTFFRASLQGANLEGAQITNRTTLTDAFVDFTQDGNNLFILLDGANHNQFACKDCSPPKGSNVCVGINYLSPTKVAANAPFSCPNGFVGDCGAPNPNGSNLNWKSGITDLAQPPSGVPPAWYELNSTYIKAPANPNSICNGEAPTFLW